MLFQSQIISRGSGSIGGLTASHNKGGNYFRARVTPTDPGTFFQGRVRLAMAQLVNLWNNVLTQLQRDDWAVYAINTPILNPFGEPRTVTGLNMYVRVNVPRLQALQPRADNAPVEFNTGEFTPTSTTFSVGTGPQTTFDNTDAWANEDDSILLIYLSRPQNESIVFFKGPYQLAATVEGDAIIAPTSPVGFVPPFFFTEGQRLFTKVSVARADGRYSTIQRTTGLAVA